MIDLSRAMISALKSDVVLSEMLGTFRGAPAVFGFTPVPEPTVPPFVVMTPLADESIGTKTGMVRQIRQQIAIYDDDSNSPVTIERIAEYIRERVRGGFTVPDWTLSESVADGPIHNDVDSLHGRILTARITLDR